MTEANNVDQNELDKFSKLAHHWWDLSGPCAPLHAINPIRLNFVKQQLTLNNKSVIDVGCGGGIFSESLANAGAHVTGIDRNADLITVAKLHLHETALKIKYHCTDVAAFAKRHTHQFDVVTCMELLEHVPEPAEIIKNCQQLVKPNGLIFFSTINRNFTAYVKAVIGAEYILKMLPIGTHDYHKFIKPSELSAWCRDIGLSLQSLQGFSYNPLSKNYFMCEDISVNYLASYRYE